MIKFTHAVMPENSFGMLYLRMERGVHFQFGVDARGDSTLRLYAPSIEDMSAMRDDLAEAIAAFQRADLEGQGHEQRPCR